MMTDDMRQLAKALDEEGRQGLFRHLRQNGGVPQIYEALVWAFGWSGLHHVYLGRYGLAASQAAFLLVTAALGIVGLSLVQPLLIGSALALGAMALGLWALAVGRWRQALLAHRTRLEKALLARVAATAPADSDRPANPTP